MDNKGLYGKQMLGFFFLGMIFIATNFFLMALGVYSTSAKLW